MYDSPEVHLSATEARFWKARRTLEQALITATNEWRVAAEIARLASEGSDRAQQEWAAQQLEYADDSLAGLVLKANGHIWDERDGVPHQGFASTARRVGSFEVCVVPAAGARPRRSVLLYQIPESEG